MTSETVITVAISLIGSSTVAILISIWNTRKKEIKARRVKLFETLMATRGAGLSVEHVRALNMIDFIFFDPPKKLSNQNKTVIEGWKQYNSHLSKERPRSEEGGARWDQKRVELLTELLHKMAIAVGYDFDKVLIERHAYSPIAHEEMRNDSTMIRRSIRKLLDEEISLPVKFVPNNADGSLEPDIKSDSDEVDAVLALQEKTFEIQEQIIEEYRKSVKEQRRIGDLLSALFESGTEIRLKGRKK